jgi:hypothetical protein
MWPATIGAGKDLRDPTLQETGNPMDEPPQPKPPETRRRAAPDPRAFYVVWSPEGGDPVVRFPNFAAAKSAAYRLSERYPTQSFFVLKSCWGRPARPPETPADDAEIREDGGPGD